MKQFITEAARLQKLAGINEARILPGGFGGDITDFLNAHYNEAFDTIIEPLLDDQDQVDWDGTNIDPEKLGSNKQFHEGWFPSSPPDFEGCAEFIIESPYLSSGFIAQFEPFSEDDIDNMDVSDATFHYVNDNPYMIAGKKVYAFSYDF